MADNMVTLHCVVGDHDWQRKSQRGRKPTNCPAHAPIKETTTRVVTASTGSDNGGKGDKPATTGAMIELHCVAGNHSWLRESKRGKRPLSCPEHSTTVTSKAPTEDSDGNPTAISGRVPESIIAAYNGRQICQHVPSFDGAYHESIYRVDTIIAFTPRVGLTNKGVMRIEGVRAIRVDGGEWQLQHENVHSIPIGEIKRIEPEINTALRID